MSDPISGLYETATYCKVGDEKRPTLVGLPDFTTTTLCDEDPSVPAEAAEAAPGSWYVRIMFDELLDPSIEKLIPILDELGQETGTFVGSLEDSQPVTLECQGVDGMFYNIPYDGYYSPSGNAVTWPVGPSLVIKPLDASVVPVASECRVSIKSGVIKDKSGEPVPSDQLGPFEFSTQPITVIGTFPSDGQTIAGDTVFINDFEIDFNVPIIAESFTTPEDFTVTPDANAGTYTTGDVGVIPFAFVFGDWVADTEFTVAFSENATATDQCGKETPVRLDAGDSATFATQPFRLVSVTPAQGTGIAPNRRIRIDFNQPILCPNSAGCSLAASEFTVTPAIQNMSLTSSTGDRGTIFVNGDYQLNTEYTFTINAGATVRDIYDLTDFTIAEAQTVKFTTAGAIALTSNTVTCAFEPGACTFSGGVVTKSDPANEPMVLLSFNTNMDGATLDTATEATLVNSSTMAAVPYTVLMSASTMIIIPDAALPAGNYTFTLKAGATINDKLGNTYTQASDLAVSFAVEVAPAPEPFLCLGQTP